MTLDAPESDQVSSQRSTHRYARGARRSCRRTKNVYPPSPLQHPSVSHSRCEIAHLKFQIRNNIVAWTRRRTVRKMFCLFAVQTSIDVERRIKTNFPFFARIYRIVFKYWGALEKKLSNSFSYRAPTNSESPSRTNSLKWSLCVWFPRKKRPTLSVKVEKKYNKDITGKKTDAPFTRYSAFKFTKVHAAYIKFNFCNKRLKLDIFISNFIITSNFLVPAGWIFQFFNRLAYYIKSSISSICKFFILTHDFVAFAVNFKTRPRLSTRTSFTIQTNLKDRNAIFIRTQQPRRPSWTKWNNLMATYLGRPRTNWDSDEW